MGKHGVALPFKNFILRLMSGAIVFVLLGLPFDSLAQAKTKTNSQSQPNQTAPAKNNFKLDLISYHDFLALSPAKQAQYIKGLREIVSELSTAPGAGARLIVENQPRMNLDTSLWWLKGPATQALLSRQQTKANAELNPCDQGQVKLNCIEGGANLITCICQETSQSFEKEYDYPTKDNELFANCAQTGEHELIYFGGQRVCVVKQTLNDYKNNLGQGLHASFTLATTDAERSRALGSSRNRTLKVEQVHAYAATGPTTTDYFSTISNAETSVTLMQNGAANAVWESSLALGQAASAAALAEQLPKITDKEEKQEVIAEVTEKTDTAVRLVESAENEHKEYSDDLQRRTRVAKGDKATLEVADEAGHAIANGGRVRYNLTEAADEMSKGAAALEPQKDSKEMNALRARFLEGEREFREASDNVKKEIIETSEASQEMVAQSTLMDSSQERINAATKALETAATAKTVDLSAISYREELMQKAIEVAAKAEGVELSPATKLATAEETRICLDKGRVMCSTKHGKEKEKFLAQRRDYLTSRLKSHACIFAGNASFMSTGAEQRNGKKNLGCVPVKETVLETTIANQEKITLTCPQDGKFKKPVVCEPMLFGALKDSDGNLHARCVEWTSVNTADCNYVYPMKPKKKAPDGMSWVLPQEILADSSYKLESRWIALADVLNLRCNQIEFRSIHCDECDILSSRLAKLKAAVTENTCDWPSDVRAIRENIKKAAEPAAVTQ